MAPKIVLKKSAAALKTAAGVANANGGTEEQEEVPMGKKLAEASEEQNEEVPTGVEVEVKRKSKNRKRKINNESYKCYIFRVLKQVHRDVGISSKAIAIVDNFINDFFDKLVNEACKLAKYAKKNTVTSREIQAAAKLILPGELSKHAVREGNIAVAKFLA